MSRLLSHALVFGLVFAGSIASGSGSAEATPRASNAAVGPKTSVPYGWVGFCNRYGPECDGPALPAIDIDLTAAKFRDIEQVNRTVNTSVQAITDMDHWGVVDQWDYPTDGKGDCEDFALQKRKLLIAEGFPQQALLMTVVRDGEGEGHAILTIKTNRGEFVLDNLNDRVKPWTESGYAFVKRQSQEDQNVWVSIGTPAPSPAFTAR